MPTLYVVHADGEHDPYADWISESWGVVTSDHPEYIAWKLKVLAKADSAYSFDALDAYSIVAREIGPVLYVGKLSTRCVTLLEAKINNRCVSQQCVEVDDSTFVYDAMLDLMRRHAIGEPELPRRLVVALLMIAKLERMHYWGGNAKNFMSVAKLAKGNGLDEIYADTARDIAEYLSADRRSVRLMSSKLGDGSPKYACNNEDRTLIYRFLREWKMDDQEVMNWLTRDASKISIRELDIVANADYSSHR